MSKRNTRAPKRRIERVVTIVSGANGGSADQTLRTNADPVTLVRTIIQGFVNNIAAGASALTLNVEIWRATNVAGHVLPTQVTTSVILPYGNANDLIWAGLISIMRETTSANSFTPINIDMKGNRILSRTDSVIIRFAGSSNMVMNAVLTMFFKEV